MNSDKLPKTKTTTAPTATENSTQSNTVSAEKLAIAWTNDRFKEVEKRDESKVRVQGW